MPYPPYDYYARRVLPDSLAPGYQPGDGMYAQVVQDYGWIIGVDVDAARQDVLERPADGAPRERWVDYVLTQESGLPREELDDLGRNDLIARVTKADKSPTKKAATSKSASEKSDTSESGE